jgi:hypothetical protein
MLFKHRKVSLRIILSIFIIATLSLLTISNDELSTVEGTGTFDIAKDELLQQVMSADLGFSSIRGLIDYGQPFNHLTFASKVKELIISMPEVITNFIQYKFTSKYQKNVEKIYINIDFLEYLKLLGDRELAIKNGSLSGFNFAKAKIIFDQQEYKAEIRLKGDLSGHWRSKRKMSLRVNLKGDDSILGYTKFSLHKLRERQYPYDKVFQALMKEVGNLSSSSNIVQIYMNGDDWGFMDIEEHITKEFLEKQNRKDSVVVRFSDGNLPPFPSVETIPYDMYRLPDANFNIHLYSEKSSLKDYQKRKMYSYILSNDINNKDLYDFISLSKAYILSTVWGNPHTLVDRNSRYYLNPYTLKLEIITTDQAYWQEISALSNHMGPNDVRVSNFLSTKTFQDYVASNINTVTGVILDIDKYLSKEHLLFPVDKKKSPSMILNNIKKLLSNKDKYFADNHSKTPDYIFDKPSYKQSSEFDGHLHVRHFTNGKLELYNLLPYDVVIKDILYNGKSFYNSSNSVIVPSYLSKVDKVILKTPYIGLHDYMINVESEYQEFTRNNKSGITLVSDEIFNPLLFDTSNNFDFLFQNQNGSYEISKGNWIIDSPMVINGDLEIQSGAHLQFSNDSYLIVNGSITALGESKDSITFKPINDSWKGLYVLNADKKSSLINVSMNNISALESGVLKLPGAITFYKSDVDLNNVSIYNIYAEDAINIVESSYSLKSIYINNSISDGLDSDFSDGNIELSEFSNIGGDALDFSGSNVSINQVKAFNVKDKAVSAGEDSIINIKDSLFKFIGVGVASKDGSEVVVLNTSIFNFKLYAAMSFIKKDFYSAPSIKIHDCEVDMVNAYLRQRGTYMAIDNLPSPEKDIDVNIFYKSEVMAK